MITEIARPARSRGTFDVPVTVSHVKLGQPRDAVGGGGAAGAGGVAGPLVSVGVEIVGPHEVMYHQLRSAFEQVEQADLSLRAFERVWLVHPDHGQSPAVGVHPVPRPGELLLLHQQLLASGEPLLARHHLEQVSHGHRKTADRFRADVDPLELATQSWAIGHGLASLVVTGPLPPQALAHAVPMLTALFTSSGDDPDSGQGRRITMSP